MNVLFISYVWAPRVGGIERTSWALAHHLAQHGHNVNVVTHELHPTESRSARLTVYSRPSPIKLALLVQGADVVYQNNPSLTYSWPLILWRRPTVIAVRTWILASNGRRRLRDKLKIVALSRATVIANSAATSRSLGLRHVQTILNGYDDAVFRWVEDGPQSSAWGARPYDVAFVGRLVTDKGVDILLLATHACERQMGRLLRVAIVGDGPERAELGRLAARLGLGGVEFLGELQPEAVAEVLRAAKVLVVPSRWREPFGVVALEGMASGCVAVVTDGGGLEEAVGTLGVVVRRGDAEALATGVAKALLDEDVRRQASDGLSEHLAQHTSLSVLERYRSIITAKGESR